MPPLGLLAAAALLSATVGTTADPPALLVPGRTVERSIRPGQSHTYGIDMRAGDFLHVTVAQKGADLAVAIVDPGGRKVRDANLGDFRFALEPVSFVAAKAGRHRLVVRPGDGHESAAPYTITCAERRPAEPRDAERVRAEEQHSRAKERQRADGGDSSRQAIEAFEEVRARWMQVGDPAMAAAARIEAARSRMALGEVARAREDIEAALAEWHALGDAHQEARARHLLGEVHYHLSDYPAALDHLRQALARRQALADGWGEAETLGDLSAVLSQTGETRESLAIAKSALAAWRRVRHLRGEEAALSVLGYAHFRRGEWQAALDLFTEALPLKRRLKDREGEAATLSNIGSVHTRLGEAAAAITYYRQALALWHALGHRKGRRAPSTTWPPPTTRSAGRTPPARSTSARWRCGARSRTATARP